jgi:hypothetical protein
MAVSFTETAKLHLAVPYFDYNDDGAVVPGTHENVRIGACTGGAENALIAECPGIFG